MLRRGGLRWATVLSLALGFVWPSLVEAQIPKLEITPYLGYRFGGGLKAGAVNQPTLPGLEDLNYTDGLNLGLSIAWRIKNGFLLEVFGERMDTRLELDKGSDQSDFPVFDLYMYYVHLGINYEVNDAYEQKLRPIAGVSLGAQIQNPSGSERSAEARVSVGILLGVKYFPGDTWGVRVHGRFMTSYLAPSDRTFCNEDLTECYRIPETTFMTQMDISAGLIVPIY
jgi:hypothetical protein